MTERLRPLCRYCGKPIPRQTGTLIFNAGRDRVSGGGLWVECSAKPRTVEEAQKLTNRVVVSHRWSEFEDEKYVSKVGTWDGESYADPYFCKNACAQDFAHVMAQNGRMTTAYERADRARREKAAAI